MPGTWAGESTGAAGEGLGKGDEAVQVRKTHLQAAEAWHAIRWGQVASEGEGEGDVRPVNHPIFCGLHMIILFRLSTRHPVRQVARMCAEVEIADAELTII